MLLGFADYDLLRMEEVSSSEHGGIEACFAGGSCKRR